MAVAFLPTYQQAGMLAPVLLVVLRLIQGFAVAGEISGASSMILEHAPFGRRGYYASFTLQGVQAGQILAAAVFLPLAHYLPTEAFNSWGWRVPFFLQFRRHHRRLHHSPARWRKPRHLPRRSAWRGAAGANRSGLRRKLAGHAPRRRHGTDDCHSGGRDDLRRRLRGADGVWAFVSTKTSICGSR